VASGCAALRSRSFHALLVKLAERGNVRAMTAPGVAWSGRAEFDEPSSSFTATQSGFVHHRASPEQHLTPFVDTADEADAAGLSQNDADLAKNPAHRPAKRKSLHV
jgi:hypothetical protein